MTPGGIQTSYVIRYCPLHAAAPELLIVAKKYHDQFKDPAYHKESGNSPCRICEIIASATAKDK